MAGAAIQLPSLQLSAIALESNVTANVVGAVAITLPSFSLLAAGGGYGIALTLPTPVLNAQANTAVMVASLLTLPAPTLTSDALTGNVCAFSGVLPAPTLAAGTVNTGALVLPAPRLIAAANTGVVARFAGALPTPQVAGVIHEPFTANAALTLPSIKVAIASTTGGAARLALVLPALRLLATAEIGIVGTARLTLPIFQLAAEATGPLVGVATLALPKLQLQASGVTSSITPAMPDGDVLPAIAMHSETGALSTFLNYPFNSMALFNGQPLGTSAEGLFLLTGNTDNGVNIDARARLINTDGGTTVLKRVDRAYVGYRASGDMVLRVITDEIEGRDYLLAATQRPGLHGGSVRIGRGLRSRYWQFELRNLNGADFSLDKLEFRPVPVRRRIGGADA